MNVPVQRGNASHAAGESRPDGADPAAMPTEADGDHLALDEIDRAFSDNVTTLREVKSA